MENTAKGIDITVKKSPRYENAYILSNRKGHYFLKDGKFLGNGKVAVEKVFYTYKWYQDTVQFTEEEYNHLVAKIPKTRK